MARATGLEPATSGVTGRRSNQLNYARVSPQRRARDIGRPIECQAYRTREAVRKCPKNQSFPHILRDQRNAWRRTRPRASRALMGACARRLPSGRLAQLVEHLVYTERVGGSSPSSPTTPLWQCDRRKVHCAWQRTTSSLHWTELGGIPALRSREAWR